MPQSGDTAISCCHHNKVWAYISNFLPSVFFGKPHTQNCSAIVPSNIAVRIQSVANSRKKWGREKFEILAQTLLC